MTTYALPPVRPASTRRLLSVVGSVAVLIIGVVLLLAEHDLGIAALCVGGASTAWSAAGLADARTLARLGDQRLGDLVVPLPLLPTVSAHPRQDLAWMPADIPAVVAMPDGGWGVVCHDTAVAALDRVGFDGQWHRIAEPKVVFNADDPASAIQRIPRGGDAVLVDVQWPVPHGVTGAVIRQAADQQTRPRSKA